MIVTDHTKQKWLVVTRFTTQISRVGQDRIYAPYMNLVLANPTNIPTKAWKKSLISIASQVAFLDEVCS